MSEVFYMAVLHLRGIFYWGVHICRYVRDPIEEISGYVSNANPWVAYYTALDRIAHYAKELGIDMPIVYIPSEHTVNILSGDIHGAILSEIIQHHGIDDFELISCRESDCVLVYLLLTRRAELRDAAIASRALNHVEEAKEEEAKEEEEKEQEEQVEEEAKEEEQVEVEQEEVEEEEEDELDLIPSRLV